MEIEEIITVLTHLLNEQRAETGLEITLQADSLSREIILSANRAGLILLALDCMKLTLSSKGGHFHFDESSNLTSTNASLIIQRSI